MGLVIANAVLLIALILAVRGRVYLAARLAGVRRAPLLPLGPAAFLLLCALIAAVDWRRGLGDAALPAWDPVRSTAGERVHIEGIVSRTSPVDANGRVVWTERHNANGTAWLHGTPRFVVETGRGSIRVANDAYVALDWPAEYTPTDVWYLKPGNAVAVAGRVATAGIGENREQSAITADVVCAGTWEDLAQAMLSRAFAFGVLAAASAAHAVGWIGLAWYTAAANRRRRDA